MIIPEDSILRNLPNTLSREQFLVFDGIRFAALMADIAYCRLFHQLEIIGGTEEPKVDQHDIATTMLDAWSIVDSVNRLRELLLNARGVSKRQRWMEDFRLGTAEIDRLRNRIQHQREELRMPIENGNQIYGYLSWAEWREGKYTGRWWALCPGSAFVDDTFLFVGPMTLPFDVPLGRIRLDAFGERVYLGRTMTIVRDAITALIDELGNGGVKALGPSPIARRWADGLFTGGLMVEVARNKPGCDQT